MIATIAVGIAIDDTIHIMVRFHGEMSRAGDQKKALAETLLAEIPPVLSTSLALSLGFAILVASNFLFLNYFGALSAMVIVVALLCDLFVSPLLLAEARLVTLWDMLSVPLRKQVLQGSQLFDGMSRWQVKKVILLARRIVVPKGECVVRQGERGETMYLILEGSASVEYAGDDGKRVSLRELHGGEFFGEIALVGETERTADVKATENATLLELDWNSLERLGKTFPGIAARFFLNISHVLGRNLADMNRRVGAKEGLLQQFRSR